MKYAIVKRSMPESNAFRFVRFSRKRGEAYTLVPTTINGCLLYDSEMQMRIDLIQQWPLLKDPLSVSEYNVVSVRGSGEGFEIIEMRPLTDCVAFLIINPNEEAAKVLYSLRDIDRYVIVGPNKLSRQAVFKPDAHILGDLNNSPAVSLDLSTYYNEKHRNVSQLPSDHT